MSAQIYIEGRLQSVSTTDYGYTLRVCGKDDEDGYATVINFYNPALYEKFDEMVCLDFYDRPDLLIPVYVSAVYSKKNEKAFPIYSISRDFAI